MKSYWTFCCCSVTKSCLTFYDPMDCCSRLGSSVLYCLPEFAQTNVCWVSDAIQLTHPPFSPCLQFFPASESFPMSQFFASGGQSFGASTLPSVLPMNIQGWFSLGLTALVSLLYKELSRSLLQHHSLKASILWCSAQPSLRFNSHIHTQLLEKPWLCLYGLLLAKWCLCSLICCLGLS